MTRTLSCHGWLSLTCITQLFPPISPVLSGRPQGNSFENVVSSFYSVSHPSPHLCHAETVFYAKLGESPSLWLCFTLSRLASSSRNALSVINFWPKCIFRLLSTPALYRGMSEEQESEVSLTFLYVFPQKPSINLLLQTEQNNNKSSQAYPPMPIDASEFRLTGPSQLFSN